MGIRAKQAALRAFGRSRLRALRYSLWKLREQLYLYGPKETSRKVLTRLKKSYPSAAIAPIKAPTVEKWSSIEDRENIDLSPIGVFDEIDQGESYTSVVTDSIGKSSLFGGVGTALILGTLIANRRNQPLRIITRTEHCDAEAYLSLIHAHGLELDTELVMTFNPRGSRFLNVPFHKNDLYITTSWWTTESCRKRIPKRSILYLLQEDERCFYPNGATMLQCTSVMKDSEIHFAINSKLLWEHFRLEGFHNIQEHGSFFEPAFTRSFDAKKKEGKKKLRFFFYARPLNPRNLYSLGVHVINLAIMQGIINPKDWDIFFVGSNLTRFCFDEGTVPELISGLNWQEYCSFLQTIDVGLSLMATPHPSYPPIDLAAAGAAVVTNSFGCKKDLNMYSRNILCCEANTESLLKGLSDAVELAKDRQTILRQAEESGIETNWSKSLEAIVSRMAAHNVH